MKPLILALLLAPLAAWPQSETKSALSFWKEDFSDPSTLSRHWSSYGFLASGIDAKNPLGKPVSGKESRPEWWQLVDGTLRGQNFPEEKHGSGIGRNFSGRDVRLRLRFKIPPGGMAAVSIRGQNPIVEKNFAVASLHIRADGVAAPIRDRLNVLVATLWVSGIAGRMPKSTFASVAGEVMKAAGEIERRLRA